MKLMKKKSLIYIQLKTKFDTIREIIMYFIKLVVHTPIKRAYRWQFYEHLDCNHRQTCLIYNWVICSYKLLN